MPLRMYSMSLAPPRSSTMQHLKQEPRLTQTDKQPPGCITLVSIWYSLQNSCTTADVNLSCVMVASNRSRLQTGERMDGTPLVMMFFYQIQIQRY